MLNLIFSLGSAIIGVAMFGAVLMANAKAEASTGGRSATGDEPAAVAAALHQRPLDIVAIDEPRMTAINLDNKAFTRPVASRNTRLSADVLSRTHIASPMAQMAAQIPNGPVSFRQM